MLFPLKSKAILCTNDEKVKYQTLARNITTNYTYTEENGTVKFQITLSNIQYGFSIVDVKNKVTYPYKGSEIIIPNLEEGTSYRFDVYTDDLYCGTNSLYSHYVTLPSYNPYYQDSVCVGMESYPICQKWTKMTLSYEDFKVKVESLKKVEEKPIEKPSTHKNVYDYLLEFYLQYYYIILPTFIIGGIGIIYFYNKKNDLF